MKQLDVFRHSPEKLAKDWRTAAETSRRQFPLDESRARWYEREAERYEQQMKESQHETV